MSVPPPLGKEPRPLDASVVARARKNFADFLRKSFFSKNFCFLASGGPPGALRGPSRGGNVARCIAEGVTTPLENPRPVDATTVAMNAKILRIFYENPFLVKIFAGCPPGALRGLSEGPPGGAT